MKKNEHPRCGCRYCRRASRIAWGKFMHRKIKRAIRHETKRLLARDGEDFVQVIRSTPFF